MPRMANQEHLKILKQGVEAWNEWRRLNPNIRPDLEEAVLDYENLRRVNFNEAWLYLADLFGADLTEANLNKANFSNADLRAAKLIYADLKGTIISSSYLVDADFSNADLRHAMLNDIDFVDTNLSGADFSKTTMWDARFADVDLSNTKGLESVTHWGPSTIGIDTLYKSGGKIPESFLRGCGVPDEFIAYIPSLIGAQQAIQFYSCFISYSGKDEDFARRLYSRMRDEHLRVWFAPEELKGGEKLREQIDRAIQVHDRLLIVLSEHSLCSRWVETEIRRAHATELREKRRKLFPIRLVSYERLQAWECFDSDTGEDLAREVREYYIPDFTNWKEHDSFETEFAKLLKALRAAEQM